MPGGGESLFGAPRSALVETALLAAAALGAGVLVVLVGVSLSLG
ncbi:hypothetical protein [Actinopolyspora mzabensis]|nr:hypothetical protein [Actinopolyspora mzabensis]